MNSPRRLCPTLLCALPALLTALTGCQLPDDSRNWSAQINGSAPEVRRALSPEEGETLFQAPTEFNVPSGNASLNDTARLLAGLSASGRDVFSSLRGSQTWVDHQRKMDELWTNFDVRHAGPIRSWAQTEIGDLQRAPGLFYPFSGPDFLFAHTFFPTADTIVLCGLEPCEPLPPLNQLSADELSGGLDGLVTSISTAMQFSFFITKDMRRDLVSTRFRGVLPLILSFMARTGHRIESVDLVRLDANGTPILVQGSESPGIMIRAYGPNGAMRRVFYFRQDLSNESLRLDGPFLRFVSAMGNPPALVKSASYLMHESYFSTIRSYLTGHCRGIVQDPSGVPYSQLLSAGLDLRLYGNYSGTLEMFSKHNQPDLIQAYREGRHNARPIDFGIGYMYNPDRTSVIVARRSRAISWLR